MIIDIHSHIWMRRLEASEVLNLRMMERYDIQRMYVSALSSPTPTPRMAKEGNEAVYSYMKRYPDKIGGFVYVSPEHANATEVVMRGIEKQGFSGIKVWISTLCDEPCVDPIAELAAKYRVPLLIHAFKKSFDQFPGEASALHVARLAKRHPDTKIIMAHLGGNCYDGLPQIAPYRNVWVDISGGNHNGNELNYARQIVGAKRILFGTDAISFSICYGQVCEADLTKTEREDILYRNALRILDTEKGAMALYE